MADVKKLGRIYSDGPNPAVQSAKDDCDINVIMKRALAGADISGYIKNNQGVYGDFTQFPDLREAMLMSIKAREMFMALDPYLRKRFDNDPALLVEFCEDRKNYDEAVKLGLINAPVEAVKADILPDSKESKDKANPKDSA